jgi:protein-disulfide isomerase
MSSRNFLEERRQKKKQQNLILILLMGGGVALVIGAIVFAVITSTRVNLKPRQIRVPEFTEAEQYGASSLGDPEAPVVIEEFSDFSCSHCGDFAMETKKLLEDEYISSGKATLVFRSVGWVTEIPPVLQATESAYCAGEQGAFWQFHDLVFANQASLFTNPQADVSRTMETFAEMLELDLIDFNTCLADNRFEDKIAADAEAASQLGVTGTPSFFINGVPLRGNQPFENFQEVIEQALLIAE